MIRFWNKYNGQIILSGVIILMIVGAQDKEPIADDDLSWHQTIGILISFGIAFSLVQIAS